MSQLFQTASVRLILYSFLMLFVELALIRWLGSNILFLSFFSNFVLLGSFLGIGIGFIQQSSTNYYRWGPVLLGFLAVYIYLYPVGISYSGSGLNSILVVGNYNKTGLPIWITLPFIFLFVTAVMASLAHGTSIAFRCFKPLNAYRLDILGSLTGIVVFSVLSYFNAYPAIWGGVVFFIFTLLFMHEWGKDTIFTILQISSLLVFLGILCHESFSHKDIWSPYYKISVHEFESKKLGNYYDIFVNGIPHQRIQSIADRKEIEPFYFLPYQHRVNKSSPEKILIIGAGTGGDTAIALANGAKYIDAVEIDPVLYELGRQLNPNKPYSNQNVHIHINDGRAFLEQTHELYDVILFALPDSLTLISGQSSLRLESYLFTQEAILAARNHLKQDGVFAMYNYYMQPWLIDRLAKTLSIAFNQSPCIDTFNESANWLSVLTVSSNQNVLQCPMRWSPITNQYVAPATDNHPFLYLKNNRIPFLYGVTLFFISVATFIIIQLTQGSFHAIKSHLDLFFMGMAFLLLETKSIASFSLLFGTTWIVNALVFAGILSMVYLAIEITHRFPLLSSPYIYGLLLLSLAIGWILPEQTLLSLPVVTRFISATLLIFSPIFLANLIFTTQFQHAKQSTVAFGVNMIGAMMGGLLEYFALITGYRFLLILIAIFYSLAFLVRRTSMVRAAAI